MAFDREAFKKAAEARAATQSAAKLQEKVAPVAESKDSALSAEELQVVKAYREWKEKKGQKVQESAPAAKPAASREEKIAALKEKIQAAKEAKKPAEEAAPAKLAESKDERIARLRRKLEKAKRVEAMKKKLAEKRQNKDTLTSNDIRKKAAKLKEKIADVRKRLKEEEIPMDMDMQAPMEQDNSMAPMAPATPLPPEIVAEIQNIASAAQSLAQLAGVAPVTPELGPDVNSGIPAPSAGAGMAPAAPAPLPEAARKERLKAIAEKIKARRSMKEEEESAPAPAAEGDTGEAMVEAARARIAARREALKQLRAKALDEAYEETPPVGGKLESEGYVVVPDPDKNKLPPQPKVANDPAMKGSATLKAGKTWPTKPTSGKKTFEAVEEGETEGEEKMEESWTSKAEDRFLERKELDFKALLKAGRLG